MYCNEYLDELAYISKQIDLNFLKDKSILISGGTGLIGSYLIDLLSYNSDLNIDITCLVTNVERAKNRFNYFSNSKLSFVEQDLAKPFNMNNHFDYVLHLASFSDPRNYSKYPVETMLINFNGTKSMLDIAKNSKAKFLFSSSCEIYGVSNEEMIETNYGLVNPLDVRSCYNESKRASETLCVSYNQEYGVEYINVRLSRIYGPTMKISDTKALSQFLNNALDKKDIVLKSKGNQEFSYCYVSDAVMAMLFLLNPKNNTYNDTYNVTNSHETYSLFEIATMVANINNNKVIFELPSNQEQIGYSRSVKSILNTEKIENLGWKPLINFKEGVLKTYQILSKIYR